MKGQETMSETAEAPVPVPVLLWEGQAAMFAAPDGGRVIRYDDADGGEQFVAIPAELVPALEMLRANPGALVAISNSPMGGMARRMVGQLTRKAADGV
jgi:hypothetical protein